MSKTFASKRFDASRRSSQGLRALHSNKDSEDFVSLDLDLVQQQCNHVMQLYCDIQHNWHARTRLHSQPQTLNPWLGRSGFLRLSCHGVFCRRWFHEAIAFKDPLASGAQLFGPSTNIRETSMS